MAPFGLGRSELLSPPSPDGMKKPRSIERGLSVRSGELLMDQAEPTPV
jgi:hypothetical protein